MAGSDDLTSTVMAVREASTSLSAGARLLDQYWPAAPVSSVSRGQRSGAWTDVGPDGVMNINIAQEDPPNMVERVAKDVGRGVIELPRSVVGGVRDAVQNTVLEPINGLASWLEEQFPLGSIEIGSSGVRHSDESRDFSLPNVPEGETVTGDMVRHVTQFLVGFLGPGKLAVTKFAPAARLGTAGRAAVQGAVADFSAFNEHEARLSDLLQEVPAIRNPVTEYLASSEDDGFIEGRLKNALEGLGLGVATEGLIRSLKAMRAARIAKRAESEVQATAAAVRPEIAQDAFELLGDESAPALATREVGQSRVAGPASDDLDLAEHAAHGIAQPVEPEAYINFARIDAPEDVQNVMQQMADAFKGDVDAARRGEKMTFAQMELSASQEDAFKVLLDRRQGQPLNAEQSLAARQLWAASGQKLTEVAKIAADNPSEANLFAFRKMLATHYAIQNEVIAARTETARALASWRIPAGSGMERFAQIENALRSSGDLDLSREMATRIAALSQAGMHRELDQIVRGSVWARSRDAFLEAWVNGLLSSPPTHLVNMMSNTSVIFQQMYERAAAAQISRILGVDGGVQLGEATAQLFGMLSGFKDALRYSAKSFLTNETGYGMGKIDLPRARAISAEAWGQAKDSPLGRSLDVLGAVVTMPGRALGAEDEFFKTLGYRMELNALAVRRATHEVNSGIIRSDQVKERVAAIVSDPPTDLRLEAIDQATYQTFTSAPGELTKAITRGVNSVPLAGRLILPFVRTPANILKYSFERTPLAPLMAHVRADIAAGGARRDIALARITTGSLLMATAADMAMSGVLTGRGPSDRRERQAMERSGWQPYSIKVGDRYFAYNRLDPIGTSLGLSADMVEILANMDDDEALGDAEVERTQAAIVMSIANNVMNKTYMSGLAELVTAMSDPQRYGEGYFQRFAGSLVPAGVATAARATDPYALEADTMLERIRSRIPGLTKDLPVRRDLWGEPIAYRSGLGAIYDAVSPIYSRREKPSPIDKEMLRLEAFVSAAPRKTGFDGVTINLANYPGAYSRFVELAGRGVKNTFGLSAKDYLDAVVTGKHVMSAVYERLGDGPDGGKADFIRKTINDFRVLAKKQLLEEYPAIKVDVAAKKRAIQQEKLDALMGR
ncbi:hypothetical protein [Bordetella avium]|uniref:hypothetical protein n=1 Tax=Bordetella avium TaxID=521 RepID=UPI0013E38BB8|nr:hypothetical protein [Bordetella avium]